MDIFKLFATTSSEVNSPIDEEKQKRIDKCRRVAEAIYPERKFGSYSIRLRKIGNYEFEITEEWKIATNNEVTQ